MSKITGIGLRGGNNYRSSSIRISDDSNDSHVTFECLIVSAEKVPNYPSLSQGRHITHASSLTSAARPIILSSKLESLHYERVPVNTVINTRDKNPSVERLRYFNHVHIIGRT